MNVASCYYSSYLLLGLPGAPFVASLLLVAMPGAPSSFLLLYTVEIIFFFGALGPPASSCEAPFLFFAPWSMAVT